MLLRQCIVSKDAWHMAKKRRAEALADVIKLSTKKVKNISKAFVWGSSVLPTCLKEDAKIIKHG